MKLFTNVALGILVTLFVFVPTISAADEQRDAVVVVLAKTETIHHDYFAAGDVVHVSGTVNGDAYVAGGTVIVDGIINGDLLTAGGTVAITGQVKNDVRVAGGTVTIDGAVGGNVTAGSGSLLIPAAAKISGSLVAGSGTMDILTSIGKGMTIGAGALTVNGKIGGDALVGAQSVTFNEKTSVKGNLTYWSEQSLVLVPGATVAGTLTYHQLPKSEKKPAEVAQHTIRVFSQMAAMIAAVSVLLVFAFTYLFGILIRAAFPEFTKNSVAYVRKNPLPAFGIGFISAMVIPFILLILFGSIIGIPLALVLTAMVCLLYVTGHSMASYYVGNIVSGGEKSKLHPALQLCIGMLLLGLLTLIPVFGWMARCVIVIMGVGAVISGKYALYTSLRSKKLI